MTSRPLSGPATAMAIAALGAAVGLAGDACHVATHTTRYLWPEIPTVGRSAVWFPALLAGGLVGGAWLAKRAHATPARRHGRAGAVVAATLVLALYALTAALRDQPTAVSVALTGALAVAVWAWWDPSRGAFAVAIVAAIAGPVAEIAIVATGASEYREGSDGLAGVAPWLPCLYFAAGAVTSGLWSAVARDGAA